MDATEMRAWQYREETGHLPDEIYVPDGEESDPEITAMVVEQYALTNEKRARQRLAEENAMLRQLLADKGVEIPASL